MAQVLLTHSYLLALDPKQRAIGKAYPPLATLYAASVLRALGHTVAVHDPMLESSEASLADALALHDPRILVVYDDGFNYLTKMCLSRMRAAALEMVRMGARRDVWVLVSSSDSTDHPELYLAAGASAVIVGEGEETLAEAVRLLLACGPGSTVPSAVLAERAVAGLALPGAGGVMRTPARPLMTDLDPLPAPAWDLVDLDRYRRFWRERHGRFSLNVSTTRGCPYACNWCAKPIYGKRYSVRSPESVAEEWATLAREQQPDHLWVTDDIFGLKPGWIARFRDALRARGTRIPFVIQARVDLIDQEVARALAEAGCESVWVGAESGAQSILDAMEKGTTVAQIEAATRALRKNGVRVCFFLQFGYPGERWPEIEATLRLVRRLEPDDIGISVAYPLPGTTFHERVQAAMGEKTNWVDSADLDPIVPGAYSRRFYHALHRRVHAEFRARRGPVAFGRMLRGDKRVGDGREVRSAFLHALLLPGELLRLRFLRHVGRRNAGRSPDLVVAP